MEQARKDQSKESNKNSGKSVGAHLQDALDAISNENYLSARVSLNRAIVEASGIQLGECYAMRGFVHLRLKQREQAEDDCSQSIQIRGYDAETLSWRAAARGEVSRWREAFEDLDLAKHQNAGSAGTYQQLMESYLPLALNWFESRMNNGFLEAGEYYDRGMIQLLMGDRQSAAGDFQSALKQNNEHGPALVGLARVELANDQPDQAVRLASQALQLDENCTTLALPCRSRSYLALGQLTEAIEDVNRLREKIGDNQMELLHCAMLRCELGDLYGAIDDLNLVAKLNPSLIAVFKLRAEVYAEMRNYEKSLENYTQYLELVPGDEAIWLARGEIHRRQEHFDLAMKDYDRALKIDDICATAFLGRCQVFLALGKHSEALEESERAIRLDSRNAETFIVRGTIFHDQKRYKQAIAEFDKALELAEGKRQLAQVHYLRGVTHHESGSPPSAIDDFKKASQLRSTHAGTHIWRAVTSAKLEDWADVIEQLHQAITLRPSAADQYRTLGRPVAEKAIENFNRQIQEKTATADVYRNRGRAYQFLGKFQDAINDYAVCLNSEKKDAATRILRAQLLVKQGELERALDELNTVIKHDPQNHLAFFSRALAAAESGNRDQALEDVTNAIELDGGQARYYSFRADLLVGDSSLERAVQDYTQAVTLDPDDHLAFRKRGFCNMKQQQYLPAIADLTRSLELFASHAETFVVRGQAYLKNEQFELANRDFERAISINPKSVKAFCGRSRYLVKTDRHEQALIYLTKAIHRFKQEHDIAELLLERGRIFYQMGRMAPSMTDFSTAIDLQRDDQKAVAAARCARAIVMVQHRELKRAKLEFQRVLKRFPDHEIAREANEWLESGQGPRPVCLQPPKDLIRPTRPPITRKKVQFEEADPQWESAPPFDMWIVRSRNRREFGPIKKSTLDDWVRQGRVDRKSKLLKTGWREWRRADEIYAMLQKKKKR